MAQQEDVWGEILARLPEWKLTGLTPACSHRRALGLQHYKRPLGRDLALDWNEEARSEYLDAACYRAAADDWQGCREALIMAGHVGTGEHPLSAMENIISQQSKTWQEQIHTVCNDAQGVIDRQCKEHVSAINELLADFQQIRLRLFMLGAATGVGACAFLRWVTS